MGEGRKLGWIAALSLLTTLACTSVTDSASCENQACPSGQTCDGTTRLCVLDLSPRITLVSPLPDAGVNGSTLRLAGQVTFATGATEAALGYQLGDGGPGGSLRLDGGTFDDQVLLPVLDGADLTVLVEATDSQLRTGRAVRTVLVDNVRPVPRFDVGDGTYGADIGITVDFAEPVSAMGNPLVLVPSAGTGGFDGVSRRFVVSALDFDTGYTLVVPAGAVRDRLGNPNVDAGPLRFWTAARPVSSQVLPGVAAPVEFASASDPDGAVTVVLRAGGGTFVWGKFDPGSAAWTVVDTGTLPAGGALLQAVAGYGVGASGDPDRVSGFVFATPSVQSGNVRAETASPGTLSPVHAVIPTGGSCSDGPGAAEFGTIEDVSGTATYLRASAPSLPLGFVPERVAVRSRDSWEVVAATSGKLARAIYSASCTAPATLRSETGVRSQLAAAPRLSVALAAADRSLYVYDLQTGAREEACFACVNGADAGTSCPATAAQVAPPGLVVASAHQGAKVLGAAKLDGGVTLLERDLELSCASQWTPLATVPASAAALQWEPQMFGRKPGLVYLLDGEVRVLVP